MPRPMAAAAAAATRAPRSVKLLAHLVHGHVAGGAHQHLPHVLLRQVVDQARRSHRFAGARRALNQAQGPLQHRLHRAKLRVVELRQVGRGEVLGQIHPKGLRLHVVAQELTGRKL